MKIHICGLLLLLTFQVYGEDTRPCVQVSLYDENLLSFYNKGKTICDKVFDQLLIDYAKAKIRKLCEENKNKLSQKQDCSQSCTPVATVGFDKDLIAFPIYDQTDCQSGQANYKALVNLLKSQQVAIENRNKQVKQMFLEKCKGLGTNGEDVTVPPKEGDEGMNSCSGYRFYKNWSNGLADGSNRTIAKDEQITLKNIFDKRKTTDFNSPEIVAARNVTKLDLDAIHAQKEEKRKQQDRDLLSANRNAEAQKVAEAKAAASAAQELQKQDAYCKSLLNPNGSVSDHNHLAYLSHNCIN